jgi:uncharacterized protein involved in tolerance to divalent cations
MGHKKQKIQDNLIIAKEKGKTIVITEKQEYEQYITSYITIHLYQLPKTQLINIKEP